MLAVNGSIIFAIDFLVFRFAFDTVGCTFDISLCSISTNGDSSIEPVSNGTKIDDETFVDLGCLIDLRRRASINGFSVGIGAK
jgi:hypothetical protein